MLTGVKGAITRQNVFVSNAREALRAAREVLQDAMDWEGVDEEEEDEMEGEHPGTGSRSSDLGASARPTGAGLSVAAATKKLEKQRVKSRGVAKTVAGEVVRLVEEASSKLIAAVKAGEVVFTPPQVAAGVSHGSPREASPVADGPSTPIAAEPISPASRLRDEAQGGNGGSTSHSIVANQAVQPMSSGEGTTGPSTKKRRKDSSASGPGDAPRVAPSRRYDPEVLRQEVRELVAEAGKELLRPPSEEERERVQPNAWMVPPILRTDVAKACNSCLCLAELEPLPESLGVPFTPQSVIRKLESDEGIQELCEMLRKEQRRDAWQVKQQLAAQEEESRKDEIEEASTTELALTCPLYHCRLSVPVRTVHCTHLKCFDLRGYLQTNRNMNHLNKRGWRCPFCWKSAQWSELFFDAFVESILLCTTANKVVVSAGGEWEAVHEHSAAADVILDSDDEDWEGRGDEGQGTRANTKTRGVMVQGEGARGDGRQATNCPRFLEGGSERGGGGGQTGRAQAPGEHGARQTFRCRPDSTGLGARLQGETRLEQGLGAQGPAEARAEARAEGRALIGGCAGSRHQPSPHPEARGHGPAREEGQVRGEGSSARSGAACGDSAVICISDSDEEEEVEEEEEEELQQQEQHPHHHQQPQQREQRKHLKQQQQPHHHQQPQQREQKQQLQQQQHPHHQQLQQREQEQQQRQQQQGVGALHGRLDAVPGRMGSEEEEEEEEEEEVEEEEDDDDIREVATTDTGLGDAMQEQNALGNMSDDEDCAIVTPEAFQSVAKKRSRKGPASRPSAACTCHMGTLKGGPDGAKGGHTPGAPGVGPGKQAHGPGPSGSSSPIVETSRDSSQKPDQTHSMAHARTHAEESVSMRQGASASPRQRSAGTGGPLHTSPPGPASGPGTQATKGLGGLGGASFAHVTGRDPGGARPWTGGTRSPRPLFIPQQRKGAQASESRTEPRPSAQESSGSVQRSAGCDTDGRLPLRGGTERGSHFGSVAQPQLTRKVVGHTDTGYTGQRPSEKGTGYREAGHSLLHQPVQNSFVPAGRQPLHDTIEWPQGEPRSLRGEHQRGGDRGGTGGGERQPGARWGTERGDREHPESTHHWQETRQSAAPHRDRDRPRGVGHAHERDRDRLASSPRRMSHGHALHRHRPVSPPRWMRASNEQHTRGAVGSQREPALHKKD